MMERIQPVDVERVDGPEPRSVVRGLGHVRVHVLGGGMRLRMRVIRIVRVTMVLEQVMGRQRLGVGMDVHVLAASVLVHELELRRQAGRDDEAGGGQVRDGSTQGTHARAHCTRGSRRVATSFHHPWYEPGARFGWVWPCTLACRKGVRHSDAPRERAASMPAPPAAKK